MSAVITAPIGAAPKPAGFVRRLFRDKPLGAAGDGALASAVHRGYQLGALAMDAYRFDPAP